ncbi:hypothetical protein CISG_04297 [Coccidioides immitis RMSCC 3703]|uniref:Uncharacterized protein n=1 Tax=Coccidioides immitis RMSCC 3703 TaxID=454286 RepID=A0A0J8QR90_COCIT|nr:hypothetical protein CISG_04297 [Coccidioides immitis RMSCC 3703]
MSSKHMQVKLAAIGREGKTDTLGSNLATRNSGRIGQHTPWMLVQDGISPCMECMEMTPECRGSNQVKINLLALEEGKGGKRKSISKSLSRVLETRSTRRSQVGDSDEYEVSAGPLRDSPLRPSAKVVLKFPPKQAGVLSSGPDQAELDTRNPGGMHPRVKECIQGGRRRPAVMDAWHVQYIPKGCHESWSYYGSL